MSKELNKEIAEKVFKHNLVLNKTKKYEFYTIGEPVYYDSLGCMELQNPLPCYSSDISAAWEVVEKMFSDDWKIDIEGSELFELASGYKNGGFDVKFSCKCQARGRFKESADTLPEAICLAALKAYENV